MADLARDDVTVNKLRAIDYEYANHFSHLVALCATSIIEVSSDPAVLDSAYQWRMWAMPQARAAAFDQDPFAGMLELWALAGQQRHYFTEGEGRTTFGDHQGCAIETAEKLERDIHDWAASVMSESQFNELESNVDKWIDDHLSCIIKISHIESVSVASLLYELAFDFFMVIIVEREKIAVLHYSSIA